MSLHTEDAAPYPDARLGTLKTVLQDLARYPSPTLENPPNVKKRASVALIVRIKPHYAHWPERQTQEDDRVGTDDVAARIERHFSQDWVQYGDPEILFIKRAARKGDRWTGHIALPGGRRDPGDQDDSAAAVRETQEEVGVDLTPENAIAVGNLPQRLVTTSWGTVPLMILCPYVYLITNPNLAPLRLQPTEIASAHWVPLRALLAPAQRTYEAADVSSRLVGSNTGLKKWLLRASLGHMLYSAVRLLPSESVVCSSAPGFVPAAPAGAGSVMASLRAAVGINPPTHQPPLHLWGLTLGVVADFLELLPPHRALDFWAYPTFSPPDVSFSIWALSARFRRRKARELGLGHVESAPAAIELGMGQVEARGEAKAVQYAASPQARPSVHANGYFSGSYPTARSRQPGAHSSAVNIMLDGYFEYLRRGVVVALVGRVGLVLALAAFVWRYRKRQSRL